MEQVQDVKWPPEYTELTRIEELLHCRICYEYIETSVVTPCSHNYCSICIRKFLHYKTQCPVCFENIYEKDLHANRILDEFLSCYLTLRNKLLACIKGAEIEERRYDRTPVKPSTPNVRTSQFSDTRKQLFAEKQTGLIVLSPEKINSKETCSRTEILPVTPTRGIATPGTSNDTPRINHLFLNKSEEKFKKEKSSDGKKVACPVCSIEISDTRINRHLDDCLKRQRSMSPPKNANSLQRLPKYVINLLKDSELRKILKEYGLSTSGVRKVLEKRIQRFSTLYNVERDKLVPKSVEEIVRQCEADEIAEKNISKQNSTDNMLNIDRKTDKGVIDKAHRQYLKKHKGDYQKLIDTINGRNNAARSLFGEDSLAATSSTSQNSTNQSIFNESGTNSSGFDLSQGLTNDSDSTNTSCPLQRYSRDDPMKFLALQLSTDSLDSPLKLNSSSSRNQTPIRSSIESRASVRSETSSDKLISSPIKLRSNSSSRNETPTRFGIASRSSLQSGNSYDKILSSPIKIESGVSSSINEPLMESEDSSDRMVLSNPSASSTIFSFGSKDSTTVEDDVGKNPSVKDIFDASTEDNWSEPYSKSSSGNRSKKLVMKRSKLDLAGESTDSETDVERSSVRSVGRNTKKQRHRNRKGAKDDGSTCAESRAEKLAVSCGLPSSSQELNKENSGVEFAPVDSGDQTKQTRRSSRKRTLVSTYTPIPVKRSSGVSEKSKIAGKKVLDEQAVNAIVDVDPKEERSEEGPTKPDSERDDGDGRTANAPEKRSLRKRHKL